MQSIFNEAAFDLGLDITESRSSDSLRQGVVSKSGDTSKSLTHSVKKDGGDADQSLLSAYVYTSHIRYFIF